MCSILKLKMRLMTVPICHFQNFMDHFVAVQEKRLRCQMGFIDIAVILLCMESLTLVHCQWTCRLRPKIYGLFLSLFLALRSD